MGGLWGLLALPFIPLAILVLKYALGTCATGHSRGISQPHPLTSPGRNNTLYWFLTEEAGIEVAPRRGENVAPPPYAAELARKMFAVTPEPLPEYSASV